MSLKSRPRV